MGQRASAVFDSRRTVRARRGYIVRREQALERPTQRARRKGDYDAFLDRAENEMDERFAANECPTDKLMNFKILGFLHGGGCGSVFAVERTDTKEKYALKVQQKEKFSEPYYQAMLVKEKKFLYAFQNDFIIKGFFAFQDWKNLYLVMEYAPYGDLTRLIATKNPKKTVKYIAAQMILGIEYLHACKVVHRDLKPGNVFVGPDLYLKIGDFGFAKKMTTERTKTILGTILYKAPEMLGSDGYGIEVDWWAMGVIIYRLLYIYWPFGDNKMSDNEAMECIKNDPLIFPGEANVNAPHVVFIRNLLKKDLSERLTQPNDMKRQEWFKDISFLDIFEKKITMSTSLPPVEPKVFDMYSFMPRRRSGTVQRDHGFSSF